MRTILSIVLLLGLAGAGTFGYLKYYRNESTSNFRTAPVERGDMLPTIDSTGSLEPEQVVDIGSQVNGLITELKVDYGSAVEKNTVLAQIDPTLYQATVDQNQAAVNKATADLALAKANQVLAEANLKRDEKLLKTPGAIAPSQYDTDFAACEVAKANVGVEEAAIRQAEAALRQSTINLGYCDIKSPVKGTIVDRRVNVGQTVVSSLSASSLFLLAKDLSRIQVWASVNEADIGRIRPGVKVHFSVDAYPNEIFVGEVSQVRLNATMTQNVVTYTVVVTTENKDMKLLPYMTANLQFEIERHENVLKVPNAALRWKPRPKQILPEVRAETLAAMNRRDDKSKHGDGNKTAAAKDSAQDAVPGPQSAEQPQPDSKSAVSADAATGLNAEAWKARMEKHARQDGKTVSAAAQGPKSAAAPKDRQPAGRPLAAQTVPARKDYQPPARPVAPPTAAAHKEHHESSRLWKVEGEFVRPIPVKVIATDGMMTEVRGKDLVEGMDVVIGESVANDADSDTTNPFMPRLHSTGKPTGSKP